MKNIVKIKALLLAILLYLGACDYRPMVGAPWMQDMLKNGPEGPTNFKLGWRDGCETGISVSANVMQRSFYKFTQDYELSKDPVYYKGWKTAFTYCQRYVLQYLRRNIF